MDTAGWASDWDRQPKNSALPWWLGGRRTGSTPSCRGSGSLATWCGARGRGTEPCRRRYGRGTVRLKQSLPAAHRLCCFSHDVTSSPRLSMVASAGAHWLTLRWSSRDSTACCSVNVSEEEPASGRAGPDLVHLKTESRSERARRLGYSAEQLQLVAPAELCKQVTELL